MSKSPKPLNHAPLLRHASRQTGGHHKPSHSVQSISGLFPRRQAGRQARLTPCRKTVATHCWACRVQPNKCLRGVRQTAVARCQVVSPKQCAIGMSKKTLVQTESVWTRLPEMTHNCSPCPVGPPPFPQSVLSCFECTKTRTERTQNNTRTAQLYVQLVLSTVYRTNFVNQNAMHAVVSFRTALRVGSKNVTV